MTAAICRRLFGCVRSRLDAVGVYGIYSCPITKIFNIFKDFTERISRAPHGTIKKLKLQLHPTTADTHSRTSFYPILPNLVTNSGISAATQPTVLIIPTSHFPPQKLLPPASLTAESSSAAPASVFLSAQTRFAAFAAHSAEMFFPRN